MGGSKVFARKPPLSQEQIDRAMEIAKKAAAEHARLTAAPLPVAPQKPIVLPPTPPQEVVPRVKYPSPPFGITIVVQRADLKTDGDVTRANQAIINWNAARKREQKPSFRHPFRIIAAQVAFDGKAFVGKGYPGLLIAGISEYAHEPLLPMISDLTRAIIGAVATRERLVVAEFHIPGSSFVYAPQPVPQVRLVAAE